MLKCLVTLAIGVFLVSLLFGSICVGCYNTDKNSAKYAINLHQYICDEVWTHLSFIYYILHY